MDFEKLLEDGCDYAVDTVERTTKDRDVRLLCQMYFSAYNTADFREHLDPDEGLTFKIRQFCIEQLTELLKNS